MKQIKLFVSIFFYLFDNYLYDLIDSLGFEVYNDDDLIIFDDILCENNYLDYNDGRRENKIIEEKI